MKTITDSPTKSNTTFDIMHLIKINASPKQVYQALTTAEGIRNWWTRDAAVEPRIGGKAEFGFYQHQFVINMAIEDLKPSELVSWRTLSGAPGWEGTKVSFYLRAEGRNTVLSSRIAASSITTKATPVRARVGAITC